jgi:hypothetical protein
MSICLITYIITTVFKWDKIRSRTMVPHVEKELFALSEHESTAGF